MVESFIAAMAGTLIAISAVVLGIWVGRNMTKTPIRSPKITSLFTKEEPDEDLVYRHSDEAYDEEIRRKERAGDD